MTKEKRKKEKNHKHIQRHQVSTQTPTLKEESAKMSHLAELGQKFIGEDL